jgi:hypothetical protein
MNYVEVRGNISNPSKCHSASCEEMRQQQQTLQQPRAFAGICIVLRAALERDRRPLERRTEIPIEESNVVCSGYLWKTFILVYTLLQLNWHHV